MPFEERVCADIFLSKFWAPLIHGWINAPFGM